ncbi:hypothetical protein ACFL2K_02895 [Candidatus Margulisiibacteriota bacterium]
MKKLVIILSLMFLCIKPVIGSSVYFYVPEANINNYISLKNMFIEYLSSYGDYNVQPFNKKEIFEKALQNKRDGIFIMSSWQFKNLRKKYNLKPYLVMLDLENTNITKEVLIVYKNMTPEKFLKGGAIASSRDKKYVKSILKNIFKGRDISKIRVINVPRDMDALMSVGFGMAHCSLVLADNLEILKKINPNFFSEIKKIGEGDKMLRPLVVATKNSKVDIENIIAILEGMGKDPKSKALRQFIGFSTWKKLTDNDYELLLK